MIFIVVKIVRIVIVVNSVFFFFLNDGESTASKSMGFFDIFEAFCQMGFSTSGLFELRYDSGHKTLVLFLAILPIFVEALKLWHRTTCNAATQHPRAPPGGLGPEKKKKKKHVELWKTSNGWRWRCELCDK